MALRLLALTSSFEPSRGHMLEVERPSPPAPFEKVQEEIDVDQVRAAHLRSP